MKTMGKTWQEWPSKQTEAEAVTIHSLSFHCLPSSLVSISNSFIQLHFWSDEHQCSTVSLSLSFWQTRESIHAILPSMSPYVCMWQWWLTTNIVINVSLYNNAAQMTKTREREWVKCTKRSKREEWKERWANASQRTDERETPQLFFCASRLLFFCDECSRRCTKQVSISLCLVLCVNIQVIGERGEHRQH